MRSLIIISMLMMGALTQAQEASVEAQSSRMKQEKPLGFIPYVALNAGYTGYSQGLNVDGVPSSIKILGSYYPKNTMGVYDFGVGYQGQQFSQDNVRDKNVYSTIAELAARYQFDNRWQLGGVYNQLFNKGPYYGANQADAEFLGVQFNKEISFSKENLARIGGRFMSSLNSSREAVNMVMLDIAFGWETTSR